MHLNLPALVRCMGAQTRGKLIVIDGTDGSGKATQTTLLVERLQREGHRVKTLSFPTYGTRSCKGVELYLRGELGTPEDVGPYLAAMLFAHNRAHEVGQMRTDLESGTHYVLDRYASANAGHQGGKIKDTHERERFLRWVFELEFDIFKIPKPDVTILLHVPAAMGQRLVLRKAQRGYLNGAAQDAHEADLEHLEAAERAYLFAARQLQGWVTIECARPGAAADAAPEQALLSIQEIHEQVHTIARQLLGK
jgi:dTMP kinase